jgi:hypothetical protein
VTYHCGDPSIARIVPHLARDPGEDLDISISYNTTSSRKLTGRLNTRIAIRIIDALKTNIPKALRATPEVG